MRLFLALGIKSPVIGRGAQCGQQGYRVPHPGNRVKGAGEQARGGDSLAQKNPLYAGFDVTSLITN